MKFEAKIVLLVALSGVQPMETRAQTTLVGWDVSGKNASVNNPLAASTLNSSLSSVALSLGSGVTASSAASTFGGSGFDKTSLASAISGDNYISFTLTPVSGSSFSLSSISLLVGVATAVTNFNVAVMTSASGFVAGNQLASFSFSTASPSAQSITLSGVSNLQGVTTSTEFRIYGWRDTSGTSTFRIRDNTGNDLSLSGSVAAIPEPETIAVWLGALALGAAIWRKRRSRSASGKIHGPES